MKNRIWNPEKPAAAWGAVAAMAFAAGLRQNNPDHWIRILDDANLVFHEAGHPLFGLLGPTAGLYGGTLGQLVFPVAAAASFWRRREAAPYALSLAWLFENLLNIARYMEDARAQVLPLVGGGEHDWTQIFSRWGVLRFDTSIAQAVSLIGWLGIGGCAVWIVSFSLGLSRNEAL